MTEEERRKRAMEEIHRQQLMGEINQQQAVGVPEPVAPPPEPVDERTGWQKVRDRATAGTQGFTWNWGDEFTSAATATALGMFGEDDGSTWGERYKDVLGAENARHQDYMDQHTGEALGWEVAGGLLSRRPKPVNVRNAQKLVRATRFAGRPQKLIQATKAAGRRRRLAREELAIGGPLKRGLSALRKNTGQGIAEGAIAGAGVNSDDRMEGAGWGAFGGAVVPAGLNVGKGAVNQFAKQRIVQEMGKGLEFIPMHLAAKVGESSIANFYRDFLGRAFGSKTALHKQQSRVIDPLEKRRGDTQQMIEEAEDRFKASSDNKIDINSRLNQKAKAEAGDIRTDFEQRKWDAADNARQQVDDANTRAQNQIDNWDNYPDEVIDAESRRMRVMAGDAGLPARADLETRNRVLSEPARDGMNTLKNWWNEHGFTSVKNRKFQFGGGVNTRIREMMKDDPDLAYGMRNVFKDEADILNASRKARGQDPLTGDELDEFLAGGKWIEGDVMMSMRNFFAKRANRMQEGQGAGQNRDIANTFDKDIRRQLGEGSKKLQEFDEDIARYRGYRQYRDSTKTALGNKKQGEFDADDYMANARTDKLSDLDEAALSSQVVRDEALTAQRLGKQATGRQKAQDIAGIGKEKTVLTRALTKQQRKAQQKAARDSAADPQRQAAADEYRSAQGGKVDARRERRRATEEWQEMNKRIIPAKTTPTQQMAATMAIGAGAEAMLPMTGLVARLGSALIGGTGVASFLSAPGVQRALAGQSGLQKAIKKMHTIYKKSNVDIPEQIRKKRIMGVKLTGDEIKLENIIKRARETAGREYATFSADR